MTAEGDPHDAVPARVPGPPIICPIASCETANEPDAELCRGCGVPLAGYVRMLRHPAALFNRGLQAARGGDSAAARELFAAVVLWYPHDNEARNAHALACLDCGDRQAARRGWEQVLRRAPRDPLATRGLAALRRRRKSPSTTRAGGKGKGGTRKPAGN